MKSRLFLAAICTFFLTTSISFGYTATFLPRLSVQGQYTDNVLLTPSDFKEHDIITTVSPGFTGELVGKKGSAAISYDASYAFYDKFDDFNGWRHRASLSGKYLISKNTNFNIKDNFLYTEDPNRDYNIAVIRTEEPSVPIDTTERKSRRIYTTNFASVGLNHQFGKNHSFRLGFTHYLLNNDNPTYEDNQSYTPSVGLTYWFGPQWGFDVDGSYGRTDYEFSDNVDQYQGSVSLLKRFGRNFIGYIKYLYSVVSYEGKTGDDKSYVPSAGFRYDIEKDISLIADFGYFFTDSERRDNTSGPSGDLRMIKRFEHGQLNLAVLGGYNYSLTGAENLGYSEYYEASVSFSHQLAKHVNGNVFGSYRDTKYKDQSDREDKRPTVGLGFSWEVSEWMYIGLDYQFRTVDSTIDSEDYTENRVSIRVTLAPTQPFHTSRY